MGEAKIGRMSSKRIPGEGKSGYWRREARIDFVKVESSVELEVCPPELVRGLKVSLANGGVGLPDESAVAESFIS